MLNSKYELAVTGQTCSFILL